MDNYPHLLSEINDFLRSEFHVDRYPASEQGGIYRPGNRPVKRIGLLLEPFLRLVDWSLAEQLDALWIHRPWQLETIELPPGLGVVSHHLPFDETLAIGYSSLLAEQLGATSSVEPLGYKQATDTTGELLTPRPVGMLLDVPEQEFDDWLVHTKTLFGGQDRAEAGRQPSFRSMAVVGAMTDTLVREAANRGANLYLTGQYRKPAQEAVDLTHIAVIAAGHRRSEEWGLQRLADQLRKRWLDMDVVVRT